MNEGRVARHKTALTRVALSRPMATAISDGVLSEAASVFDYGCGRGDDMRHLRALGYSVDGWDPSYRAHGQRRPAEVVNLGYVINVVERPAEREEVLRSAWELTQQLLVVSARMSWDARDLSGRPLGDGLVTSTGTFQKFYNQGELADLIEESIGERPYAAAPGIFYVFRDPAAAQRFVASRVYTYRPRVQIDPKAQYQAHQAALAPLLLFMQSHARPPKLGELPLHELTAIQEALGSMGQAQRLIRQVTDDEYWDQVAVQRRAELLTYVAMSRFGRRPRFSQLDGLLANDIRALFGSYETACGQADRMLMACGDQATLYLSARRSRIGKQTPSALYVHRTALAEIPPVLQVYEGCARVLSGTVQTANLIKLSVAEPQISYLTYPRFDRDPHPTLASAVTVNLRRLTVDSRDYSGSENPPLLHRKEEFLGERDPRRPLLASLTRAEMRAGLYEHPERIGNLQGWLATLQRAGVSLRGHRLARQPPN